MIPHTEITTVERVLEPEIMDGRAEAEAYAAADFSDSNQWYVDELVARFPHRLSRLVDLGCGPADVPLRIARAAGGVHITAVDGSAQMLRLAHGAVLAAGLAGRIRLEHGRLPDLALPERSFDAVLSKDMLHHLPDPRVLWGEARRLARAGGAVFVMDLMRPDSPAAARAIVERVASREHPVLKEDFYNSLCAAFTPEEVRAQLESAGLPLRVEQVSDRHMLVSGTV
ncbi:MAG TPA: class I SAM-dependent methyltransferase [Steroidobacteraceae bacterium]|nr:class I SAM-dependent methyltransferase [Steroidobacteraceae bacterium]